MSDEIEGPLKIVNDLSKSQWTRTKALEDLARLGAIKELYEIVNDKIKSDWVRKQAMDGLSANGAYDELKKISDNSDVATWVRKTSDNLISKMAKQPKEFVEVCVSIDIKTKEAMDNLVSNTNRSISDVIKSFIEEGKSAHNLRDEIKEKSKEIHLLKEEILSLKDLRDFNIRLRKDKTALHDQAHKINISLKSKTKEAVLLNRALRYTREYSETLKSIINELDCEFIDHFLCPKCGSKVTLITKYKINGNKIEATDGYCLDCL